MKKKDDTAPVVKPPKATPNPGQIFEEPVEGHSETGTVSGESADAPAQPDS